MPPPQQSISAFHRVSDAAEEKSSAHARRVKEAASAQSEMGVAVVAIAAQTLSIAQNFEKIAL